MEVSPIRKYRGPSIPTHEDVENRPDLLLHIPTRWQTNPAVLTALASVTMLSATGLAIADAEKAKPVRVAPVFQHGEGRGSFGCMSVAPPICLSEDEARQIISDEVKRSGIMFETPKPGTKPEQLRPPLDGVDKTRKFAYVFASVKDATVPSNWSVSNTSTISKAKDIAQNLENEPLIQTVGVFYDPIQDRYLKDKDGRIDWSKTVVKKTDGTIDREATLILHKKLEKQATDSAKQQLRLQVRDFVKWLKAQGVI